MDNFITVHLCNISSFNIILKKFGGEEWQLYFQYYFKQKVEILEFKL